MTPGAQTPRPTKLGRYELITQIGQGGMAEVQLAIQRGPAGFEKLVVVKLVHENLVAQKGFVDMLLEEAKFAALVKHPNVVDIYDLGEADGRYFIAMEYLEGEPLLAVLRAGREGKRLDPLSTARLIADTAEGLDAAHELRTMAGEPIELVHHDVSLGNIVVLYNGQVKLVDFGVAKATQSAAVGDPRARVQGKFSYMAPEKLRGGAGDRRSDIWSLGCVLWEALTLRRLFKGGNDTDTMRQVLETVIALPSEVNGEVAKDFDPIVMKALDRDPDKRYATAKEMAADLEEVLRQSKYGGKNDIIAKYMQATFGDHIAARKHLLQEVSSKGRASADVLEAAFDQQALAQGTPAMSGEFSLKLRRPSGEMVATELAPGPSTPLAPTRAKTNSSNPPFGPDGQRAGTGTTGAHAALAQKKRLAMIGGGAGMVLCAVLAIVIGSRGGNSAASVQGTDDSAKSGSDPVASAVPPDAPDAVVANGAERGSTSNPAANGAGANGAAANGAGANGAAANGVAADGAGTNGVAANNSGANGAVANGAGANGAAANGAAATNNSPGSGSASPQDTDAQEAGSADEPTGPVSPPKERPGNGSGKRPPKNTAETAPKGNAQELFKTGMQSYVKGDAKTAVTQFRRALQINPSFATAWRALGFAHEKLGEWGQAKMAFQKYLALSPNASDAAQIRERIGNL